jgi:hypothetical protein
MSNMFSTALKNCEVKLCLGDAPVYKKKQKKEKGKSYFSKSGHSQTIYGQNTDGNKKGKKRIGSSKIGLWIEMNLSLIIV